MSNIKQFPSKSNGIDEDKYKAFIGILIEHDGSIEVTLPPNFSNAELLGMLEMAKLITMDNFEG
jgi:hypothetical protein